MKKFVLFIFLFTFMFSYSYAFSRHIRHDMVRIDPGLRTTWQYGRTYVKEYSGIVVRIDTAVKWDRYLDLKRENGETVKIKLDSMTDYKPSWSALKEGSFIKVKADANNYASYIEVCFGKDIKLKD